MIIIQLLVCIFLLLIVSAIVSFPYFFIKGTIRTVLYWLGLDLYTEDEKVKKGMIAENRIEQLKRLIEIEDECGVPLEEKVNNLYSQIITTKAKKAPKNIEYEEVEYLALPEDLKSINKELKRIENKSENKTIVIPKTEKSKDDDLNDLSRMLENLDKKYS
jgi:hypothetical protein